MIIRFLPGVVYDKETGLSSKAFLDITDAQLRDSGNFLNAFRELFPISEEEFLRRKKLVTTLTASLTMNVHRFYDEPPQPTYYQQKGKIYKDTSGKKESPSKLILRLVKKVK